MKTSFLQYLLCPDCHGADLGAHTFAGTDREIESGLLLCHSCRAWYPVVEGIPVISKTPVLVDKWQKKVRAEWGQAYDFSTLKDVAAKAWDPRASEDQAAQIEFYEQEADRYDVEITNTPFWRAFAKQTVHAWGASPQAQGGTVLEVGCGTGASTTALVGLGCKVVALDICLETAKQARDKVRKLGLEHAVDFIISEAEEIPFREGCLKGCIFSGVLHHVSDPVRVLKQISRVLCEGGALYGHENNASAFRFLFDLLMKMKRLWHEEAGTHPLMKPGEVRDWGRQAGLDIRAESAVFLPPHFFNLFPQPLAENILLFTDRIFGRIPWVKDQGGLLIISGTKIPREVKP